MYISLSNLFVNSLSHNCMNCIESHYLSTKPIAAIFLRRLLVLAEKIWNETNLQEVAQGCMF